VSKDVIALCNSDTLTEQATIWNQKLRPVLLNPVVVALLKHPVFCWNALGVPLNQRRMLLNEGTAFEFVRDTLDPLASTYSFKNGAYFYLLVSARIALSHRFMFNTAISDFIRTLYHVFLPHLSHSHWIRRTQG